MDSLLSDVWFDIAGVPVKWHVPVGVLYDYYVHANNLADQQTSAVMKITIHFQSFPKCVSYHPQTQAPCGTIMRWPTVSNTQSQFFYSLKEAHFIKHGDISFINKLPPAQINQLWSAVQLSDIRSYRTFNETLCPISSPSFTMLKVPVRAMIDPALPLAQFGLVAETATIADVITHLKTVISTSPNLANKDSPRVLFCNGLRVDDQPSTPLWLIYQIFYNFDNYLYFAYIPVDEKCTDSAASDAPAAASVTPEAAPAQPSAPAPEAVASQPAETTSA